jgi:hypothetical protein
MEMQNVLQKRQLEEAIGRRFEEFQEVHYRVAMTIEDLNDRVADAEMATRYWKHVVAVMAARQAGMVPLGKDIEAW